MSFNEHLASKRIMFVKHDIEVLFKNDFELQDRCIEVYSFFFLSMFSDHCTFL
jgi:hypothetical protein